MVMDDEKVRALREAAGKATPGWRRAGHVEDFHVFIECSDAWAPELGRVLLRMNTHFPYVDDAAFIAACDPTTILALLGSHAAQAQRIRELEAREVERSAECARVVEAYQVDQARLVAAEAERDELRAVVERFTKSPDTPTKSRNQPRWEDEPGAHGNLELLRDEFRERLYGKNPTNSPDQTTPPDDELSRLRAVVERVRELAVEWEDENAWGFAQKLSAILPPKADQATPPDDELSRLRAVVERVRVARDDLFEQVGSVPSHRLPELHSEFAAAVDSILPPKADQ